MNKRANKPDNLPSHPSGKDESMYFMLKAISARAEEMKDEADTSQITYPLGIDTDLTTDLKKLIDDPISHFLGFRESMGESVSSLITRIFKAFLRLHSDIIEKVFSQNLDESSSISFYIVLREDTMENRTTIFQFLRDYKATDHWRSFPIYFQFISAELSSHLGEMTTILDNSNEQRASSKA